VLVPAIIAEVVPAYQRKFTHTHLLVACEANLILVILKETAVDFGVAVLTFAGHKPELYFELGLLIKPLCLHLVLVPPKILGHDVGCVLVQSEKLA